ncbi:MAG: Ig-like domain-containing protein [Chloroflexota bacterium]
MKQLIICLLILILAGCNLGEPGDLTPIPAVDLPTVEILSPTNNQEVLEGIEFDFDIVARDTSDGIARVELYIDEVLINTSSPVEEDTVPIFRTTMNWRGTGVGRHIVEVIAYRPDDTPSDPARLTIEVLARE